MTYERPYLQVPKPSEEDRRMFEEWVKQQKESEENDDKDRGVVVIDI